MFAAVWISALYLQEKCPTLTLKRGYFCYQRSPVNPMGITHFVFSITCKVQSSVMQLIWPQFPHRLFVFVFILLSLSFFVFLFAFIATWYFPLLCLCVIAHQVPQWLEAGALYWSDNSSLVIICLAHTKSILFIQFLIHIHAFLLFFCLHLC